ncbi:MAG TPA: phosphate regulon sensor histidine kinase PhoR [Stenotrophobium sp.]|nr:phosphate regulon sensor histidine kinase PhoR [Stenotrophobium sp.]
MTGAWLREIARAAIAVLIGAAIGAFFGQAAPGAVVVAGIYFIIYLRHLAELRAWVERPGATTLPEPAGIWGDIFDRLLEMRRRNRKKQKQLSAMLAEFQASTAALPDGAVVLGAHGEIAWFNQAAQKLLGLRNADDIGLRIANLIRHPAFIRYFTQGDYEQEVESPSPIHSASTLLLRIIPYGNSQRLLIVRDISELKRLEAARRDFVANASHELRTPLTVLRGYLDMMEPETNDHAALAEWRVPLEEMRSQALRMESLVHDMLRLARLDGDAAARQEVLEMEGMVAKVVEEAKALSQGRHVFEVSADADLQLLGDDSDVRSILTNLLSNAVRYTPDGGSIRAIWTIEPDGARFSVSDTGIGIAVQDMPRLTERFYRVDASRSRATGGTGLGLSIVRHALERHDGRLEIRSELGKGSTFTCHFPGKRVRRKT